MADKKEHPEDALRRQLREAQHALAQERVQRWAAEAKYVQLAYNLAQGELQQLEAAADDAS